MAPDVPVTRPDSPIVDAAFKALQKNQATFRIWRIEKFQLIPLPKEQFGSFYNGDSYIVFSASDSGSVPGINIKTRELRGHADFRIHFWLGENTTQDEAGAAAIKTVELDDYLGGAPIQHREVQGLESDRFRSYFPNGIRYLEGGVASGLNTPDMTFKTRLYHVKGKRRPIMREKPEIAWTSMNDDDVFVLDAGEMIFVWNGKNSNSYEKIQGSKLAQKLKSEHGGGEIVMVDDGQEGALAPDEKKIFEEYLPIKGKHLGKATEDIVDDASHERVSAEHLKLYRCTDENGDYKVVEVKGGPLDHSDLDSNDSFIVDNQTNGIWVWIGKKASKTERTEAMKNAQGFLNSKKYPKGTSIVRVIDGGEPVEFKGLFRSWNEPNEVTTPGSGKLHSLGKIAQTVQTKFDAATLHENQALAAESQMVDDGSGKIRVWHVQKFDLTPVDVKDYGTFYSGDCYVILYAYRGPSSVNYLLYYWLGRKSTADEQGTAALKTIEMDNELGGAPVQIRVVQGKEPNHFMAMFAGRVVILEGGKASGFTGTNETDQLTQKDSYLLHVRGLSRLNTKATEVPKMASSLNSNDVFVLFTKKAVYIWAGKGSTGDEREAAKRIVDGSDRDPIMLLEGEEKPEFWAALGGQGKYSSEKRLQEARPNCAPRLFQCSNASGSFRVIEILDFNQDDLIPDDVMLLDTGDTIFLWIGDTANADEKKNAESIAKEYLQTDPKGRDVNTPVCRVKQGHEPPNFTGFFGVWDSSLWTKAANRSETPEPVTASSTRPKLITSMSIDGLPKYPLIALRPATPEELPEGIDPSNKEAFLADDDFQALFHMSYVQFITLPEWKRMVLKKSAGLF